MPKPLSVDKPYPTNEGLCPDAYSLRIISPAYASSQSELNSVLQYVYQSFFFGKRGYDGISQTLVSIAVSEMEHLNILGKTILSLGAAPVFSQYPAAAFNFYSAKYVSYSNSLKNMLEDDVLCERRAIASYGRMLGILKNEQVKGIISRIAEDEKLHLERLCGILTDFRG